MLNHRGSSVPGTSLQRRMSGAEPPTSAGTSQLPPTTLKRRLDPYLPVSWHGTTVSLIMTLLIKSSLESVLHILLSLPPPGGGAGEASILPSAAVPHWKGNHHLHCDRPLGEPGQLLLHCHCHRWVRPSGDWSKANNVCWLILVRERKGREKAKDFTL